MLIRIKKLFATDLVKVSLLNGISTLIKMVTSFVSVKVVAVLIGPSGIALLGQLNNFTTIFLNLSTGFVNGGVTKYISEYNGEESKYAPILRTGLWLTIILSGLCAFVMIIGAGYFATEILKDVHYRPIFIIFGCTILFYALNILLLSVINGFKEFRKYVTINIVTSVTGLIFSIVLALTFGVYGALISAVTFQSVVFIITLYIALNSKWFKWSLFLGKFSRESAVKLSHFFLMALVSALTVPGSQLAIRGYIIKHHSITDAGLWEGMLRISNLYLMVITTSLSVYYLPRLSELKTQRELRKEVVSVYRIIIPFIAVLFLTIFICKNIIISILFDEKFSAIKDLFLFQLIGDFFKVAAWVLAYQLLAKAMTRLYILTEVLSSLVYVGVGIFFVSIYGNIGATIGYAISFFIYFIVMVVIFRKLLFNPKKTD
ncbi:MAG: O-antigen translocase [Chitinophagaceae bacterium]